MPPMRQDAVQTCGIATCSLFRCICVFVSDVVLLSAVFVSKVGEEAGHLKQFQSSQWDFNIDLRRRA